MEVAHDFGSLVADPGTTTPFGSILNDQKVLPRESAACSTWRGALENVCPKKLVSTIPSWLAAVNGHLTCVRTNIKTIPKKQDLKVPCDIIRTMLD